MPFVPSRLKKGIWLGSLAAGLIVAILSYLRFASIPEQLDNFLVASAIITIFPPAILDYLEFRWRRAADENLPYLLRDVAEGQRTGMTLLRAIEEASKRRYGPLTKELKRLVTQVSWGMDLNEALEGFAERIGTPLAKRTAILIKETARSGGNIAEIMDLASSYAKGMQLIEQERASELKIYMFIVYATYFVFLYATIMLLTSFFYPMGEVAMGQVPLLQAVITPAEARRLFFHMAMIQAFLSGIVAGKLTTGKASAGLKHAAVLLTAGLLSYNWLVPVAA